MSEEILQSSANTLPEGVITYALLRKIVPFASRINLEETVGPLNDALQKYGINTPLRLAAFLAQVAHESGSFHYVEEIASGAAYDNRKDLGNTTEEARALAQKNNTTPGRFFKGRGYMQITGYYNYAACSEALFENDMLLHTPSLLCRRALAIKSAVWFWYSHPRLNEAADKGDFKGVTLIINGGLNGYPDRLKFYQRAKETLKC